MNKAERFVANLKASIESWRMPADSQALYASKISKYDLSDKQWAESLDRLIKANTEGKLIPLATILEELDRQQKSKTNSSAYGWKYYDSGGYSYAIRIINDHGLWVYPPSHKYAGQAPILPDDATNILNKPDCEAPDDPRDMPTPEEVKHYVETININLSKLKGRFTLLPANERTSASLRVAGDSIQPEDAGTPGGEPEPDYPEPEEDGEMPF